MMRNTAVIPSPPLNRQEWLTYILLAAMGMFILVSAALLFWTVSPMATVSPRVLLGQTADFPLASEPYLIQLELNNYEIKAFTENEKSQSPFYPSIWLVHTEAGWLALNRYTPPFGSSKTRSCLYAWTPTNGRFEDPCFGSKFTLDGRLIDNPATFNLTTYPITIKGNEIWLDLSQPIAGETADPLCHLDDSCL